MRAEGLGCGCDPQPVVVVDSSSQQTSSEFNLSELPGWMIWAAVGFGALLLLKKR
jgi:hypothetical protein